MRVLVIANNADPKTAEVLRLCNQHALSGAEVVLFDQLKKQNLSRKMLPRPGLLILQPRDKEQLKHLVDLSEYLTGTKKVLILPSVNREITTLAHKLNPSFLMGVDTKAGELEAVLNRIITVNNTRPEEGNGNSHYQ